MVDNSAALRSLDSWLTQGPPEFDISDREMDRWQSMLRDHLPDAVDALVNLMSEAVDQGKIPFEVVDGIVDSNRIMGRLAGYIEDDPYRLGRILLGLGIIESWKASLEDYTETIRQADDECAADAAADHAYDAARDGD